MNNNLILIDAHVHIHKCYDRNIYLNHTFDNFKKFASEININKKWIGVLYLTEIDGVNYFNTLKNSKIDLDTSNFKIENTAEENSFIISNLSASRQDKKEEKLIIIAGKQILAKDTIEVLALGTSKNYTKNNTLEKTITEINESNAIAVLPWGVGKWLGKRKNIVKKFISENSDKQFFLGDNSGRPTFWTEPDIYRIGKSTNHFILPGTDALALPTEVNKTGTFGLYLNSEINLDEPARDLLHKILNLKTQPKTFGNLENPIKFLNNQIGMQILKYKKK